jgi:hypothetical protein
LLHLVEEIEIGPGWLSWAAARRSQGVVEGCVLRQPLQQVPARRTVLNVRLDLALAWLA